MPDVSLKRHLLLRFVDAVACLPVALAAVVMKLVRRLIRKYGRAPLPCIDRVLSGVGVFPVLDHYYEPAFTVEALAHRHRPRLLPGIRLDGDLQLGWLGRFDVLPELLALPCAPVACRPNDFYHHNGAFEAADAEFFYSLLRTIKPRRLFEIGAGHSTRLARLALARNRQDDPTYCCRHLCVEPFENDWLSQLGVELVRTPVEELPAHYFDQLSDGDILFIDSSHMIRPGGDVVCEYLEILPRLNQGVFVHVHDVFTPADYPASWLDNEVRFWNEQYLLEAFLSMNPHFTVVAALSWLSQVHPGKLAEKFPVYARLGAASTPGSFWFRRV